MRPRLSRREKDKNRKRGCASRWSWKLRPSVRDKRQSIIRQRLLHGERLWKRRGYDRRRRENFKKRWRLSGESTLKKKSVNVNASLKKRQTLRLVCVESC